MAFDFNDCKLVGPVNGRFGAAGLMVPPRVEDCPERLKVSFLPPAQKLNTKTSESGGLSRWHGLC